MRTKSLLLGLSLAALGLGFSACSDINFYEIDAPADLQDKIQHYQDSIAALQGDNTPVTITVQYVGAEDCSAAWWTEFSQYFTIPSNQMLHVEFTNYTSGAGNWNNWNLCVSTPFDRDATGYSEYFVLRSDAYGWGNSDYNANMISIDYEDLDGDGDIWNDFRNMMQGAHVVMEIDHSSTGNVYVTAKQTSADGSVTFTETYEHPVSSTDDIQAFLIVDGSHLEIQSAYLTASQVTQLEDFNAVSIVASGYPASVEVGAEAEAVWGNASAVVTFEDGSVTTVGLEDVTLTVPDLTTPGTKTVVYSYSKTKLGNYGASVAGYYNIEVQNKLVGIEAVANAYYMQEGGYISLAPQGVAITGIMADGSTRYISASDCSLTFTQDPMLLYATEYTWEGLFTVYYQTDEEILEYTGDVVVRPTAHEVLTGTVGNEDNTTGWWSAFTPDWSVAAGESQTVSFVLGSDNALNYHCPVVVLRKADLSEYIVVRMDNYGWSGALNTNDNNIATVASDWNWDTFASNLDGSEISLTVANDGNGKASIRFHVTSADGSVHYQYYDDIVVDSSDVNFALTVEGGHLVFE